jgi:hypothetical protein
MNRALAYAFASSLGLLLAAPALAQDRNPLEQDTGNPLAPEDEANPLAQWVGTFADPSVRLVLRAIEHGFEGTITVKGNDYPAKGVVRVEDGKTTLEGNLSAGGKDHPLVASLEDEHTLVLVSGGTTYTLTRQAPDAGKPEPARQVQAQVQVSPQPDLSHVHVGQRWVFALENGMEMTYTVTEVGPDLVRYDQQTWMDVGGGLEPARPATSVEFHPTQYPVSSGVARHESITVSGVTLDTVVVEEGGYTTWIAVSGDAVTFPNRVRFAHGSDVAFDLVRIDP